MKMHLSAFWESSCLEKWVWSRALTPQLPGLSRCLVSEPWHRFLVPAANPPGQEDKQEDAAEGAEQHQAPGNVPMRQRGCTTPRTRLRERAPAHPQELLGEGTPHPDVWDHHPGASGVSCSMDPRDILLLPVVLSQGCSVPQFPHKHPALMCFV